MEYISRAEHEVLAEKAAQILDAREREESERIIVNYRPSKTFGEFHNDNSVVRGVRGPIGSGKTAGCLAEIWFRAWDQEPNYLGVRRTRWACIRNSYPELKSTTIKTFEEFFPGVVAPIVYDSPIRVSMRARGTDGTTIDAEILFLAVDRPQDVRRLKSLELTGVFLNEASEFPKAVFDMALARIGRFPPKRDVQLTWTGLWMDTNSMDDDHWWHEMDVRVKDGESLGDLIDLTYFPKQFNPSWRIWTQPPALIRRHGKYFPNPEAENIVHHALGYGYYLQQIAGKSKDWIDVFILNQYGSTFDGRLCYPDYGDLHRSEEQFWPIKGVPVILGWDFGLCYDDQTEVLTESGWKFFKDVDEATDRVATRNPETGAMEYTAINFKVDRPYTGEMIEWSSTEVNMCVTPEHRIPFTFRDSPDKVHFQTAEWLANHSGGHHYVDLLAEWTGEPIKDTHGLTELQFATFLGWWMSDGTCSGGTCRIYQTKPASSAALDEFLRSTGLDVRRGNGSWEIPAMAEYVSRLGLKRDRRVPAEIKGASPETIRAFIDAYTVGDGHVRTRANGATEHTVYLPTIGLANDMQELAQKAGWNSSVRVQKGQVSRMIEGATVREIVSGDGYLVTFKKRAKRAELLRRNLRRVHYNGRIYCLNVPYHTLYVRRGGKPHWNGNTPACVVCQFTPWGQFRVIKEMVSDRIGLRPFVRAVVKPWLATTFKGQMPEIISVGDPAGVAMGDIDEVGALECLTEEGIPTEAAPSNAIQTRLDAVTYFLTNMVGGMPAFALGADCTVLHKGFKGGYHFRRLQVPGAEPIYKQSPEKNRFSHPHDALQYACLYVKFNVLGVQDDNQPPAGYTPTDPVTGI